MKNYYLAILGYVNVVFNRKTVFYSGGKRL